MSDATDNTGIHHETSDKSEYVALAVGKVEAELLPCPFCGSINGPKLWDSVSNDFATGESHWVWCGGCAATHMHRATRRDAIKAWNRRPTCVPPTPHKENG